MSVVFSFVCVACGRRALWVELAHCACRIGPDLQFGGGVGENGKARQNIEYCLPMVYRTLRKISNEFVVDKAN